MFLICKNFRKINQALCFEQFSSVKIASKRNMGFVRAVISCKSYVCVLQREEGASGEWWGPVQKIWNLIGRCKRPWHRPPHYLRTQPPRSVLRRESLAQIFSITMSCVDGSQGVANGVATGVTGLPYFLSAQTVWLWDKYWPLALGPWLFAGVSESGWGWLTYWSRFWPEP